VPAEWARTLLCAMGHVYGGAMLHLALTSSRSGRLVASSAPQGGRLGTQQRFVGASAGQRRLWH
jgi:hypothetical protein